MTDRRAINTSNICDGESLRRPDVKRVCVHTIVTHVEKSDKNNINWQTLQQIITGTSDEVTGKIERDERNKWYNEECK
jgi:hypothetical protein